MGIIRALNSSRSLKDIALSFDCSINTVLRMLNILSAPTKRFLPSALGIDEFKGNTNSEKYQRILTDLDTGEIFDILPNRNKSFLISYFKRFPNRNEVKFFVMDMTNNYKSLSFLFPNAKIITDRYPVVKGRALRILFFIFFRFRYYTCYPQRKQALPMWRNMDKIVRSPK